jgi:aminomethyltransferase
MRDSPLAAAYAAEARRVEFAGWRLPLQFSSIAEETKACRTAAALFDISHMGVLILRGEEAARAARRVLTKDVTAIPEGCGAYALLCSEAGGILDDLIVMVESPREILLVVNAANHDKDVVWISEHIQGMQVTLDDRGGRSFAVAVQGPRAEEVVRAVSNGDLPEHFATFTKMTVRGAQVLVSRTGYTGEDGFELFGEAAEGPGVWQALLETDLGLAPAGLAARDVLRQEMGYPLWGQDLEETTTPLDAGLKWAVDWGGEFVGREALERAQPTRRRIGFRLEEAGVARQGAMIYRGGEVVGRVTSGTYSHNLGAAIGQGYVDLAAKAESGEGVEIEVRGRQLAARLAKLPLLPSMTRTSWAKVKGRMQA